MPRRQRDGRMPDQDAPEPRNTVDKNQIEDPEGPGLPQLVRRVVTALEEEQQDRPQEKGRPRLLTDHAWTMRHSCRTWSTRSHNGPELLRYPTTSIGPGICEMPVAF